MLRPPGANFQLLFLRLAQAFGSRIRPDARLWFIFPSNRAAPVRRSKAHPFVGSGLKRHHPPHEASEQRNCKINVSVCGTVSHSFANQ